METLGLSIPNTLNTRTINLQRFNLRMRQGFGENKVERLTLQQNVDIIKDHLAAYSNYSCGLLPGERE